jgi:hypothetical protein
MPVPILAGFLRLNTFNTFPPKLRDGGHCGYYRHVTCTKMVQIAKYSRKIKISWQELSFVHIELGLVEWDAFTVAAILKSNMAAMWRHRRWHHLIGRTQKPMYSHLNYVCICSRTKVMVENVILGTISNGGHIEIKNGGHCGYYHVTCTKMLQMTKYR